MFKVILMIAPTHISDRILMNFDVNRYDTTGPDIIIVTTLLLARIRESIHTRSSIAIRRLAEISYPRQQIGAELITRSNIRNDCYFDVRRPLIEIMTSEMTSGINMMIRRFTLPGSGQKQRQHKANIQYETECLNVKCRGKVQLHSRKFTIIQP